VCALSATAQTGPALRGVVTDPSSALVPGALILVRGPGGPYRQTTGPDGRYEFPALRGGRYDVRCFARGFSVAARPDVRIQGRVVLDIEVWIGVEPQVVNVEEEANRISTAAAANGSGFVLGERELAALSDDPDELAAQLQAMAGPGAGPNGGQIYIDG